MAYNENYGKKYKIAIILIFLFVYVFLVSCVFLYDSNNILLGYVVPLLLITAFISLLYFLVNHLLVRHYKYSWVRALEKAKKNKEEPESYNLYPVDPKLLKRGITKEQNEIMVRFRIINFFLYCLIEIFLILKFVSFDGDVYSSIILPIIMIVGSGGVIFVILDIIVEEIVKIIIGNKSNNPNVKKLISESKIYKNNGIYYIPICIFIGIIILVAILDFNKSIKNIILKISLTVIIDIMVIVFINRIVNKFLNGIKEIDKESKKEVSIFEKDIEENKEEL